MRSVSIIVNKLTAAALAGSAVLLPFPDRAAFASDCGTGTGIVSNDIRWLAGTGDTLWMISEQNGKPALNVIAGPSALDRPEKESNWRYHSLACKKGDLLELETGGGFAVASLDSPSVMLVYDHHAPEKGIVEKKLPWPADSSRKFVITDAVWSSGCYYLACLDGGMVRWHPGRDEKTVFLPGRAGGISLPELQPKHLPALDTTRRTTAVEVLGEDSLLLVMSPSGILRFSISDSSWDSSITTTCADPDFEFIRFERISVNRFDPSYPIYAHVLAEKEGREKLLFCKYIPHDRSWHPVFENAPFSVTFAMKGYMYALFTEERSGANLNNILRTYRDSLGDSGAIKNPKPVIPEETMRQRMTSAWDIDVPEYLNNILFVPVTDSSGYLWIASSEGLFLSKDERPGNHEDTSSFLLIKRAPQVSDGLKKTYARPGILRASDGSCKFIYNIAADKARVTIKVFDYNMDPVVTIIEKQTRYSGTNGGPMGRSTVESEDSWDGTHNNRGGRPVAPGMYYYKITTDSGERAFGKIVVAR